MQKQHQKLDHIVDAPYCWVFRASSIENQISKIEIVDRSN